MPSYHKIVYNLTPEEQGAVMRHYRCRQWEIPFKLKGLFLAALAVVVDKGNCGLQADTLVKSGEIEVGRSPSSRAEYGV